MKFFISFAFLSMAAAALGVEAPLCAAKDFVNGRYDGQVIRIRGVIKDASRDDIDPNFFYFSILSDGLIVYAATRSDNIADETVQKLVSAEVEVTGMVEPSVYGWRIQIGRLMNTGNISDFTVLRAADKNLFDGPNIQQLACVHSSELATVSRAKTFGRVLATWNRDTALIRTPSNTLSRLRFKSDQALPAIGATIEAAGFPDTDLYNINLSQARWRSAKVTIPNDPPTESLTTRYLMADDRGRLRFLPEYHGRSIRLSGKSITEPTDDNPVFLLDDGFRPIRVDLSNLKTDREKLRIPRGSVLEATGVCVIDTESISSDSIFPKIRSFFIVARQPSDLKIVSVPSWWTPHRLLSAMATLLIFLIGVIIWNLSLNRLARKRGRELFDAQVDKVSSELRIDERTRLAVELHDSISQNLTGVSMQIDAAARFITANTEKTLHHLAIASRTLDSCRTELRNCIWDLRHEALEEKDINSAIRTVLAAQTAAVELKLDVDIPREQLTESTAHAILCIIRELVTNAVRHGQAHVVRVSGSKQDRTISLTVSDDGRGFDPGARPGPSNGHFGLCGIAERVRPFNGSVNVDSEPGRGTTVRISLSSLPQEKES